MALLVAVLVPVYWHHYGPGNFLWFSDIALFGVTFALWAGGRLVPSMVAVGILPRELVWTADFLTGGSLVGLAAYMFEADRPLYLRALSLFHLALPPLVIWMLVAQGYDRRAALAQTLLAWTVLPATFLLTAPEDNVNWVFGLGEPGATLGLGAAGWLAALMAALPLAVILPMHAALIRMFPDR